MIDNDAFYEGIRHNIEQHKRHLMGVLAVEKGDLDFIYTIGNHEHGLPELLMIGTSGDLAAHLMNNFCDQMLERGAAFKSGELVYWEPREPGLMPVKMIASCPSVKQDYTIQAGQYYGHENYAVMQVIVADEEGRFPGDPDCGEPWSRVPVLGVQ